MNRFTSTPFTPSENSQALYQKRYLIGEEKIPDLWKLVSGGDQSFYDLMEAGLFLPNSPTLFNHLRGNGCTSSACFVFDIDDEMGPLPTDNHRSIVNTAAKAIAVAKSGGGVGYYGGNIRPRNSLIKTVHRKACGPVGVFKYMNSVPGLITQGGKRELAQMWAQPIEHPDALDLIHVKDEDPQLYGAFNISMSWTKESFSQIDNPKSRYYDLFWNHQVSSAWKHGCPGILFPDHINNRRGNPNPHLGIINAPNPCLTAETKVAVADGRGDVSIGTLADEGKDVPVYCHDNDGQLTIRMMRNPRVTGRKEVYEVLLDNGQKVRATGNHRFLLRKNRYHDARYEEVKNLKKGDSLTILTRYTPEECDPKSQSRGDRYVGFAFRDKMYYEHKLIGQFHHGCDSEFHVHHKNGNQLDNRPDNLSLKLPFDHLSEHNTGLSNSNSSGVTNEELVQHGRMLCRNLGRRFSRDEWEAYAVENNLPMNFSKFRKMSLGTVQAFGQNCANLEGLNKLSFANPKQARTMQKAAREGFETKIINKRVHVKRTCELCGIEIWNDYFKREHSYCSISCSNKGRSTRKKAISLFDLESENHKVVSVRKVGVETVYNGTVDEFHNFFVGGFDEGVNEYGRRRVVYLTNPQCGETPNRSDEPCNLGSLCLWRFINLKTREILWGLLEDATRVATRFLDWILDTNVFPHPEITYAALLTRKLGLGIMGWADTLAVLGIHYDAKEAFKLAKKVMSFIDSVAVDESKMLAKIKGPYQGYSDKSLHDPRRNETNTSIAPTGSIAILADCFGSIEPFFGLEWDRVTAEGIRFKEKPHTAHLWDGHVPKVANELHWSVHVRMQAEFQRYTDLGVSKTINMSNEATQEDVANAYKMMYELGCKGGTIFRDGCRSEQVLTKKKTASVYQTHLPPEALPGGKEWVKEGETRPEETTVQTVDTGSSTMKVALPSLVPLRMPETRFGVVHKFRIDGVKFYLTVGLAQCGTPGEIFIRASKLGSQVSNLFDTWAISFSKALQAGMTLEQVTKPHLGSTFEPKGLTSNREIRTCTSVPDYICRWLMKEFGSQSERSKKAMSWGMSSEEREKFQARMREEAKSWQPTTPPTAASLEELRQAFGESLNTESHLSVQVSHHEVKVNVSSATEGEDSGAFCPECGMTCYYLAGCLTCPHCHWSKCG